ncbi:MAG: sigma-70 family RNA polymerase sigma factor [Acidobacteria bacterium]|nr:sigma-70 family RNA polymerase sigma factor [Acidobacteriota bacterium]
MDTPVAEISDFEKVVQVYWPRVFRFVLASIRDRDSAETLTQDCFFKAYKARSRFRGDCSVNTWLMKIAVNLVRDFARNRRLQFWKRTQSSAVEFDTVFGVPARDISPEASTLVKEQVRAVWQATEALPERQRTVFLLRFVEDMDLLEIAAATGLTEGAVKVHLFRAVHSVRVRIRRLK